MVDLMRRSGNQLAQRSELLSLHQVALETLLVFEAATRIIEQTDQGLVLEILPHEDEHAEHEHCGEDGEEAKGGGEGGGIVPTVGPPAEGWQREDGGDAG